MGFLTTVTIRNDALYEIEKHPEEFAKKIIKAASSGVRGPNALDKEFGLGSHANMTICQTPRHADSPAVYVQMGNTTTEVGGYSSYTEHLIANHPRFFDQILDHLEDTVKILKQKRKAMKGGSGE